MTENETPHREDLTVVVAGSSGLLGSAVVDRLRERGAQVTRLVRRSPRAADEVQWMHRDTLDPQVLDGTSALINLCGASIGRVPWTASYRSELIESRLRPTRMLAVAMRNAEQPPHFISASAAGYYGSAPGVKLTERAVRGDDFLAQLCADWEEAAEESDGDVALLRTAPVVDRDAILKPLIPLTKAGLAGPIGPGTQHWPWISFDDAADAIVHVVTHRLTGPVNLAGPTPTTAAGFMRELADQLRRPYLLPAPAFALRTLLGRDFADSMLLGDQQVVPCVLEETGFAFSARSAREAITVALRR